MKTSKMNKFPMHALRARELVEFQVRRFGGLLESESLAKRSRGSLGVIRVVLHPKLKDAFSRFTVRHGFSENFESFLFP